MSTNNDGLSSVDIRYNRVFIYLRISRFQTIFSSRLFICITTTVSVIKIIICIYILPIQVDGHLVPPRPSAIQDFVFVVEQSKIWKFFFFVLKHVV